MTEKQLYGILIGIIASALAGMGAPWPTVVVQQGYQPTIQGAPTAPFVALSNETIRRFGSIQKADVWDAVHSVINHSETQQYVVMFQADCQWKQDPTAVGFATSPTAGDLAKVVSSTLQSDATVAVLVAQGIGIDRITEVRERPFKDDTDAYQYGVLFDFCLTFPETVTTQIPTATPTRSGIYPV